MSQTDQQKYFSIDASLKLYRIGGGVTLREGVAWCSMFLSVRGLSKNSNPGVGGVPARPTNGRWPCILVECFVWERERERT